MSPRPHLRRVMHQVSLTARDVARHAELLDDVRVDERLRLRALSDVARANRYFGGNRVVQREVETALRQLRARQVSILDVGSAAGDLGRWLREVGLRAKVDVRLSGLDLHPALARATGRSGAMAVCGDGLALPFRDGSVDLVICSQLLHHFADAAAVRLLRELDRVARHRVIVCDLRRSCIAAAGFWVAARSLRFHPVTRHDGLMSLRRGFTGPELTGLVQAAAGRRPVARRGLGFRLAISWTPARHGG
jgi:SAM-dependent methyltransferase